MQVVHIFPAKPPEGKVGSGAGTKIFIREDGLRAIAARLVFAEL